MSSILKQINNFPFHYGTGFFAVFFSPAQERIIASAAKGFAKADTLHRA
jgi:hypothetical protein